MPRHLLPGNVQRLGLADAFSFRCHPGVSCFTHCCRQLELALTPYDVLRLKKATGLSSSTFLDTYVIIEQDTGDAFPRLYLTMVDDGDASCVFVTKNGCTVYHDRPGACRAYPTGRAVALTDRNAMEEFFILLQESHCRGFDRGLSRTPRQYGQDQGLAPYNRYNDAVAGILLHERLRQGMRPTKEQCDAYILSLYDLDTFRNMLVSGTLPYSSVDAGQERDLEDDESLLLLAIDWLKVRLFGEESRYNPKCLGTHLQC